MESMELVPPGSADTGSASEPSKSTNASRLLWCGLALLAAVGCLGIYRDISTLWAIWTTDPLRSIGLLIPPASIVLTLGVWRRCGWQLRGSWWGLLVIGLSFFLSALRQRLLFVAPVGPFSLSVLSVSIPIYVYGSGVVLLFAGWSVWRKAWFPIGLLLLSQPVPAMLTGVIDLTLQSIAARVARSFATWIHFAPTTPQLRLMFSPDFGMFIAPGCDGIRGSVTMGYVALVLGYLKHVSWRRWIAYVVGAVLLGYVFNFIRLCVLILYYRIALGHPWLENVAAQADYGIGSCLFLIALAIFFWLARVKQQAPPAEEATPVNAVRWMDVRSMSFKCAAFALLLIVAVSWPSPAYSARSGARGTPAEFAAHMPKQIGEFTLSRTWYEQINGIPVEENGAYSAPGSDEIVLGVWVAPYYDFHNSTNCWLARGLRPDVLATKPFVSATGQSFPLSTGFYNDGVTDSIVVNAQCTPESCGQVKFLYLQPQTSEFTASGSHLVSIMIRIDRLHSDAVKSANYDLLSAEARKFISGLDLLAVSKAFQ